MGRRENVVYGMWARATRVEFPGVGANDGQKRKYTWQNTTIPELAEKNETLETLETPEKSNSKSSRSGVELCSALGWDLDLPRLSRYVSRARPVRSGPYYRFPESREPSSHGRPAGLTVFRF